MINQIDKIIELYKYFNDCNNFKIASDFHKIIIDIIKSDSITVKESKKIIEKLQAIRQEHLLEISLKLEV